MILVEALDTYEKNNIKDNELDRIPSVGERFEVTESRLNVLLGNNPHKKVFVKVVEDNKEEVIDNNVKEVSEFKEIKSKKKK